MELLIGVGALFLWNQRDKNVIVSVWKQTDMFPRVVWFWFEATSYKPVTNCGCLKQKTECEKVWIRNKNKNAHPFGQWCFDHSVQTHTQDLNHNHYKGYPCALHFVHYYSVCLSLFNSKIVVFFFLCFYAFSIFYFFKKHRNRGRQVLWSTRTKDIEVFEMKTLKA